MSFLLADNKKSMVNIVISSNADRVKRFAARELACYLKKISGADFQISKEGKDSTREGSIHLSATTEEFADSGEDAFEISVENKKMNIRGSNSRSVLYGVYDFLESLGCRFIEPGIESVPSCDTLEVKETKLESRAAFPLRNIFRVQIMKSKTALFEGLEPKHHLPQIDWMAKQRLNHYVFYVDYYRYDLWEKYKQNILDALLDRGFVIEVSHHSIFYFCPPNEDVDFGNYGPSTYQQNHPDWFTNRQARIELPAVQKVIKERYFEYLRRNPELSIVGLWPGDSSVNQPYQELSHTDGYLKFWNGISEAMQSEFPNKRLCILAYFELTQPPQKVAPSPNQHVWFCRHDDNYMYPITDKKNEEYFTLLKEWAGKISPEQIACFHYYGWMSDLTPFTGNMKRDLTVYKEMKLAGAYGWSGFTFNILGTDFRWARDLCVFSRLLWNPDLDLESLEETWATGVFTDSASDVLEFYNALKKAHEKEIKKGLLTKSPWISLDLLHDLQKILVSARKKAETPKILHRINLLEQVAASGSTAKIQRKKLSGIEKAF